MEFYGMEKLSAYIKTIRKTKEKNYKSIAGLIER